MPTATAAVPTATAAVSAVSTGVEPGVSIAADGVRPVDRVVVPAVDSSRLRLADRYWLEERIGRGETSTVWRGWDEVLARPVSVFVLDGRVALDPDLRAALRKEIGAAAELRHPELVTVYDFGVAIGPEGDEEPYAVLEPLDGETLAARLERGPLPWQEAARICAGTAAALSRAHAAGIPHRDVRAAHIFLTSGGVRLLGLGLGLGLGLDVDQGLGLGLGRASGGSGPAAAKAADVRALGAVLAETLTGTPADNVQPPGVPPPDVPGELTALCRRLRTAGTSVPSATEAAELLTAAFTGGGRAAPRACPGSRVRRRVLRGVRSGPVRRGPIRTRLTRPGPIRPGPKQTGPVRTASVRSGPRRTRPIGPGRRRKAALGLLIAVVCGLLVAVVQRNGPWPADPSAASARPSDGRAASPGRTAATAPEPPPNGDADGGGPASPEPSGSEPAWAAPPDPERTTAVQRGPGERSAGRPLSRNETIATLTALRRSVDQGVSEGEIRPDVGLDLDNVITNLRNDVESGRVSDPRRGADRLADKIDTRLREGALTQRRADRLRTILAPLTIS